MGVLGSCFCFDKAEKRHDEVISTIARDLANRDPEMRRALADAVKDSTSLKNSKDIFQQWEKLLMEPLKLSRPSVGPVLIVIEALDESDGLETRRDLLHIISGKLQNKGLPQIIGLPSNFRILVTSRPIPDIEKEFEGVDHILQLSTDDIPPQVVELDIAAFVSELGRKATHRGIRPKKPTHLAKQQLMQAQTHHVGCWGSLRATLKTV